MTFTRTPGGLSEKWRFYKEPTIWVEGRTDIFFYEPIVQDYSCRMEPFHGIKNATALLNALVTHDYPYVVILDGDYEILGQPRQSHKKLIILRRYSFENYLWHSEPVNRACLRHAGSGDVKDVVSAEMARTERSLKVQLLDALILDVAARKSPSPPEVIPDAMEQLALNSHSPELDINKINALISQVRPLISPDEISTASSLVQQYLISRPIVHLLKGHFILGILRRIFLRAAQAESNSCSPLSNDAFIQILSEKVWRCGLSEDHLYLRQQLQDAIGIAIRQFGSVKVPGPSSFELTSKGEWAISRIFKTLVQKLRLKVISASKRNDI